MLQSISVPVRPIYGRIIICKDQSNYITRVLPEKYEEKNSKNHNFTMNTSSFRVTLRI